MDDYSTFPYLAGAIDSDGYISIKRSTYHRRVRGDAVNALYSEKMGLRQVTPQIPNLLQQTFGGGVRLAAGGTTNSKPLWAWEATDCRAANACRCLLPFLRVKRQQAILALELRESKDSKYWQAAYWYALAHPDWRNEELITRAQAARLLNYRHGGNLSQAVRNGTLLSLPYDYSGRERPAIPLLLVQRVIAQMKGADGRVRLHPPELIAWRERLYAEVRVLNTIGINGTPITHRTGYYTPAG